MKWFLGRFYYAYCGFLTCLKDRSIRYQMGFGLVVIVCGFLFRLNGNEWLKIIWCIGLVIAAEVVNSCIERCVDYISLKRDPRAKRIKDMAAFGVLIISICAAITGLMIFVPKIF